MLKLNSKAVLEGRGLGPKIFDEQHHSTDIGCAVNPEYWEMWKRLQSLTTEVMVRLPIYDCQDYQERTHVTLTTLVNNTLWQVGAIEAGRQRAYHSVPWKFCPDGTVSASDLWRGVWQKIDVEVWSIGVAIVHQKGNTDCFSVVFSPYGQSFTASKEGKEYRIGKLIT